MGAVESEMSRSSPSGKSRYPRRMAILGVTLLIMIGLPMIYCIIRGFSPLPLLVSAKTIVRVSQTDPNMLPQNTQNPIPVVYGTVDGKNLEMDIYPPTRSLFRKSPVIIYLHGGSWKGGTHHLSGDEQTDIFNPLREYGMTVVSVGYRLTDKQTKFPAHIEDVTQAIRYLVKHAAEYDLDTNRLCTFGASAGAHLALLAAMAEDQFSRQTDLSDIDYHIRCVVSISTPLDFVDLSGYNDRDRMKIEALLAGFLGFTYEENTSIYAAASPISYLKDDAPPVLLVHGEKDELIPIVQADTYYEKAKQAGMDITYIRVLNGDHGLQAAGNERTDPGIDDILRAMLQFLVIHLLL